MQGAVEMAVWKGPMYEWRVSDLALCFLGLMFSVGIYVLGALMFLEA